jgi:hypothetical protein
MTDAAYPEVEIQPFRSDIPQVAEVGPSFTSHRGVPV